MTPRQSSPEPLSPLFYPNDISSGTKLQNAPPPYLLSRPLSPLREISGAVKLRNATTLPDIRSSTPTVRRSSSTSTLVPLPSPLRLFKRQGRKPSLSAILSRPSIQSLKAQFFPSATPKSLRTRAVTPDHSSYHSCLQRQSSIAEINAVELLSTVLGSDDEGYITGEHSPDAIKTPRARSFSGDEEGYVTDIHPEIDLQSPTPIERRTSNNKLHAKSASPDCALCRKELKNSLETYAFPATAPSIIARIRNFYPIIDANHRNRASANWPTTSTIETAGNIAYQAFPSPTFCLSCFEKFHALHICWTCGLTVHRGEERVGYGWAWWHWGCMSCLLCRAPVSPPAWTSGAITLSDSPACRSCLRELKDLVYIERRRLNASRRGFSPPWRPDVGFGIECHNRNEAVGVDGELRELNDAEDVPAGRGHRRISGLRSRSNALDGNASVASTTQGARNSRMSWMMRKGEGAVGGGVGGSGGSSSRRVSPSHRLGALNYPPLPKWMEKLPGRRSASGGVRTS